MNDLSFDTLTRLVAGGIPRRAQGREPATAGLAPQAASVSSEAKKNKSRKTANKKANKNADKRAEQQCKNQVAPMTAFLTTLCKDDLQCVATAQQCCPLLANCDTTGFLHCLGF